ncbi:MAG TPA: hypothetical protein VK983_01785 [Candidatus Limnocylindrales bacterium]|nr:hypothetical protein [Candidatus Limnocylindrales bacterium]
MTAGERQGEPKWVKESLAEDPWLRALMGMMAIRRTDSESVSFEAVTDHGAITPIEPTTVSPNSGVEAGIAARKLTERMGKPTETVMLEPEKDYL